MKLNLKIKKEDLREKLGIQDPVEIQGEEIVQKINEQDEKIDASKIKNLPKQQRSFFGAASRYKQLNAGRNISIEETSLGYPVITNTNPKITLSDTEPVDPQVGDLWIKPA